MIGHGQMDPRLTKHLAQKARLEAELNKVETKIHELESKLLNDRSGNLVVGLEGFSGRHTTKALKKVEKDADLHVMSLSSCTAPSGDVDWPASLSVQMTGAVATAGSSAAANLR